MSKKKLISILAVVVILVIMAFVELSFVEEETFVFVNNIEALADPEVDIFKLCPEAGGHCCVSINLDVYGICMAVD